MSKKVVHFKNIGKVTFFPNRISKSIKISIKPDRSVLVSFPYFVSQKNAAAFLLKNEELIIQQHKKNETYRSPLKEGFLTKTKMHTVSLQKGSKTGVTDIRDGNITIFTENFDSEETRSIVEEIMTEIYRFEAQQILPKRLEELAQKHGFRYNKVTVRNNKTNWGSCSSKNNISLNLQMMKLPDELIDYILLHELVHTEEKNHGERFWEKLNLITGNKARELTREVKKYSTYSL